MSLHEESVRRTVDLDLPREEAWDLVVDLGRWLADDVDLPADPAPGDTGTLTDDGVRRDVVVEEVAPGVRLDLRWTPREGPGEETCVEITLTDADADPARTRVTVVEVPARVVRAVGAALPVTTAPGRGPLLLAA